MAALDRTLSLQQALWSVPLCLTVHHLEEALGVRKAARRSRYGSGLASFPQLPVFGGTGGVRVIQRLGRAEAEQAEDGRAGGPGEGAKSGGGVGVQCW